MTYSGGHIQISYFPTTAATVIVGFALIVLRQGTTVNSPTLTSAQTFYAPEQDVLWSHYAVLPSNTASAATTVVVPTAKIKTMRKLKLGDAVVFVAISSALASVTEISCSCCVASQRFPACCKVTCTSCITIQSPISYSCISAACGISL